eukprot:Gb_33704 [translate_table: standard]
MSVDRAEQGNGYMEACNAYRLPEKAHGPAAVLAMGTAIPPNVFHQNTFSEFYFDATKSNDRTDLKNKFQRICEKSKIKKRHLHLSKEMIDLNPNMGVHMGPSIGARQIETMEEVPKLGTEAAQRAVNEWGRPKSEITHLIFCSTCCLELPGPDCPFIKLFGLNGNVKRMMIHLSGCYAGVSVLRIAKDIAENNKDARVLIVCCEVGTHYLQAPGDDNDFEAIVWQALYADGAAALVVGADPIPQVEKAVFELWWTGETLIPNTEHAVQGLVRESGVLAHLSKEVPIIISNNIAKCVEEPMKLFGISDLNKVFSAVHPGGPVIIDKVEQALKLDKGKLQASREVLAEYGNMLSVVVLFVLDHMRRRSLERGCHNTGEGYEWGFLLGFGPGVTTETLVLRSVPFF